MQQRLTPLAAALAASVLLAGCNSQPTKIEAGKTFDPTASQIASAPPVKLPPSISSSMSYRCKDNSLLYVDFLSDGTSANLRKTKEGEPVALTAPEAGKPFAGGGYTVTGSGKSVTIAAPGKSAQACTA